MARERPGLRGLPARLPRRAAFSGLLLQRTYTFQYQGKQQSEQVWWPTGTGPPSASNHIVGNALPPIANIPKVSDNTDHPTALSSVALQHTELSRKLVGKFLFKSRRF
jgi:hypothetical protein